MPVCGERGRPVHEAPAGLSLPRVFTIRRPATSASAHDAGGMQMRYFFFGYLLAAIAIRLMYKHLVFSPAFRLAIVLEFVFLGLVMSAGVYALMGNRREQHQD